MAEDGGGRLRRLHLRRQLSHMQQSCGNVLQEKEGSFGWLCRSRIPPSKRRGL